MTTNEQMAHAFMYANVNESKNPRNMSVSYENNRFYSYSTCIAEKVNTNEGIFLLVSANGFSHTTRRHLNYIEAAKPYNWGKIYLYQDYAKYSFDPYYIKNTIKHYLETKQDYLKQKPYRTAYLEAFSMAENIINHLSKEKDWKRIITDLKKLVKKYQPTVNNILEIEAQLRQRREELERTKEAREQAKLEAFKSKYIDGKDLQTIARDYVNRAGENTKYYQMFLGGTALLYLDGDTVRTTKGISMPAYIVKWYLKKWKEGRLQNGEKIRHYTVIEQTPQLVTVGCHRIPVQNLIELEKELNKNITISVQQQYELIHTA